MADRLGQGQGAEKVAEVVGQGVQLQSHRVRSEATAERAGPGDRVLTFFDALCRRAALIVEQRHPLKRLGHVGHNEADARI